MGKTGFWQNARRQLLEFLFGNPVGTAALLLSLVIPLAILMYQSRDAAAQRTIAKLERRASLIIEITNARERSDTELKAEMFKALISLYFRNDGSQASDEDYAAILGLLAWNFQDHLDSAPLFELLDARLKNSDCQNRGVSIPKPGEMTGEEDDCMSPLRAQLRRASEAVFSHQVSTILSQGDEAAVSEIITLCLDNRNCPAPSQGHFYFDEQKRPIATYGTEKPVGFEGDLYWYRLINVTDTQLELEVMRVISDLDDPITPLIVSRFSPPYTTHYNMRNSRKVAVWIHDLDPENGVASFRILVFPEDYISTARRPTLIEMARLLDLEE